jgi:anti-sigma factor ChrR (cupin superfamily)
MNNADDLRSGMDACADDAANYALGTLTPEEARAFGQRLRSGCPYCLAQAEQYAAVTEQLALSVDQVSPPEALKKRLMARIQPPAPVPVPSPHMTIVRGADSPWVRLPFPGVEMRSLIRDKTGAKTLMLRMQPGAIFPQHPHPVAEQCYVLEGTNTESDGITLRAGDIVVMSGGIVHEPIHTDTGCTLLIAYAE